MWIKSSFKRHWDGIILFTLHNKSEWNCEIHFNFLRWCSSHAIACLFLHPYGMREYLEHLIEYSWGRVGEAPGNKNLQTIFLCDKKNKNSKEQTTLDKRKKFQPPTSWDIFELFFAQTRGDLTSHFIFCKYEGWRLSNYQDVYLSWKS